MTVDTKRDLPAGNTQIAHGPASIEGHTPIALKGGPLSRPGFKVIGPVKNEHLGVEFLMQATKEGFFSFVAMPSGPVILHNPKTKRPWSAYRSCLRWTQRFIKKGGRIKAGVTPL